ncbi:histidine kinase [Microtetraspora sp. NBRC 13810]|uniref:sensor histidine kinase n=1 Tax=Microtetraspora sp. NBRC 13810 TaxID=3030990 RepID=UPI00255465CA|nr:histidine kinase [Microtetraspora sp. NBRC 13810]
MSVALGGASLSSAVLLARRLRRLRTESERQAEAVRAGARESFGRDVHDLVGHWLWFASVKGELAHRLAEGHPGLQEELSEMIAAVQHAKADIRRLAHGGVPISLPAEVGRARRLLRASGVRCLVGDVPTTLTPDVSALLGTVLREGVVNVLRHSKPDVCLIGASDRGGRVRLDIANNGAGRRPRAGEDDGASAGGDAGAGEGVAAPAGGWLHGTGLRSLRLRTAALGGRLDVADEEGWFRLTAELPARPHPRTPRPRHPTRRCPPS